MTATELTCRDCPTFWLADDGPPDVIACPACGSDNVEIETVVWGDDAREWLAAQARPARYLTELLHGRAPEPEDR